MFQKTTIQELFKKWHKTINLNEIEILISHEIKKCRSFVIANPEYKINFWQTFKIEKNLEKRRKNIPIAHLTKEKEFYGRSFLVNKNTLVPRPETELIIENVLEKIKENNSKKYLIIDIGTGSGNIPVTLAKELKRCKTKKFKFIATDISKKALKIANKNASRHNVKNDISFYHSNLLNNKELQKTITNFKEEIILIANLPYVNEDFKKNLYQKKESKALKFEPEIALWSKDKGLYHYDKLMQELKKIHSKNIVCYFEISPEQTNYLTKKIKNYFPIFKIKFKKDLAGLDRLCLFYQKN